MGTGSFPGVKRPGREVDHPPPPSAEVMKEWSYTSTPPLDPCGLLQGETIPYLTTERRVWTTTFGAELCPVLKIGHFG
jgi:hypothetical protein